MNPISDCAAIKTNCTLNTSTDLLSFSLFFKQRNLVFLRRDKQCFCIWIIFSFNRVKAKKKKERKENKKAPHPASKNVDYCCRGPKKAIKTCKKQTHIYK